MNYSPTNICAVSTAPGGAIALIRLSGKDVIEISSKIFFDKHGNNSLISAKRNKLIFGTIIIDEEIVDEVLISRFANPFSYTGENMVEISCHASEYIQSRILSELMKLGCELAKPGEFSQRAFLNGKMDLSQAEAVADLIASETKASHKMAMEQMRGGFSSELEILRQKLIHFASMIELELDFSEEDVEFVSREELKMLVKSIQSHIQSLIQSFDYGNVIKEGIPVAILGKPNAGKSSLLNAFLNEERAIVSEIPGTTRDSIEDTLVLEGFKFRFIDTAGLRITDDSIEKIGVERALTIARRARIILYVYDQLDTDIEEIIHHLRDLELGQVRLIFVANKMDKISEEYSNQYTEDLIEQCKINNLSYDKIIRIQANQIDSILPLKTGIVESVQTMMKGESSVIISNLRHKEALEKAQKAIEDVQIGLQQNISGELLAIDLKSTLSYISEITGAIDVNKDILGTIFGKFCIGK